MKAPFEKTVKNEQADEHTYSIVEFRFLGLLIYRKVLILPNDSNPIHWGF